jgi:hypothetical protein
MHVSTTIAELVQPWIILRSSLSAWMIGAVCAREMGSMLIIFFSIVRLLVPYTMKSSVVLGCLRLYIDK